jgi:hypothetical protein
VLENPVQESGDFQEFFFKIRDLATRKLKYTFFSAILKNNLTKKRKTPGGFH